MGMLEMTQVDSAEVIDNVSADALNHKYMYKDEKTTTMDPFFTPKQWKSTIKVAL